MIASNCIAKGHSIFLSLATALLLNCLIGCTARPPFMVNADPALRKTSAEFSADAAHRHFETDAAPAGPINGRVEIDYGIHRLSVENSSNEDWTNVELWLNKQYVILLPVVPAHAARTETVNFTSIFDRDGHYFPLNSQETPINSLDLYKDGKMYSLPMQLAD